MGRVVWWKLITIISGQQQNNNNNNRSAIKKGKLIVDIKIESCYTKLELDDHVIEIFPTNCENNTVPDDVCHYI